MHGPLRFLIIAGLTTSLTARADGPKHRADQAPGTTEQIARGHDLYVTCGACHGTQGEGIVGMAPRLNSDTWLAIVSDDFLFETIQHGRPGTHMIPWGSAMSEDDIRALVFYIRSWQVIDGIPLDESPLKGNAAEGSVHYRSVCARCHGGAGAGYSAMGPGTGIGRKGFLDHASNGILRAIIRYGKSDTPMEPFNADGPSAYADLSDEQVDSIIHFLRDNAW